MLNGYQKVTLSSIITATKEGKLSWIVLPRDDGKYHFCEFKKYGILVKFITGDHVSVKVYCGNSYSILAEFEDQVHYGSGPYCAVGHELMHAILDSKNKNNPHGLFRNLSQFIRDIKEKEVVSDG
jgi:hypothetical protein